MIEYLKVWRFESLDSYREVGMGGELEWKLKGKVSGYDDDDRLIDEEEEGGRGRKIMRLEMVILGR